MENFEWPWEYNFPPFFTLQLHAGTRDKQLSIWSQLLLKYHKFNNQSLLNVNEDSALFHNEELNRKLSIEGRLAILDVLQKNGNAAPFDKRKLEWDIYWHTLEEWSKIIYDWASETGQLNTVCTIYEISNGDNSLNQEFHQLDQNVIVKALRILESKERCELMQFDDNQGVKFF